MTKAEIRRDIAVRRAEFQPLEPRSAVIVEKFQTLELFQTATTIGLYMPLPDEVDVAPLFQTSEKSFFIPAFDDSTGSYRLAKQTPTLRNGKFGIPEPENPVFAATNELDLILVPGIAFDPLGHRIGRGGGFYDRLLPLYNAPRLGVCFDFQCLERVPAEAHDCTLDYLLSETRFTKVCDEH